ncbi:hypothetical protein [Campylobacter ureolyticus]|uniref:Uncharacterized protein n=1 Tax=Campylobacter ureolyticus TaxID=827 RepID=A0AAE7JQ36_9BACT|nr:hypothetical protein [Campylobacter ureolyticus]MCR8685505.1 hypothetical protein [Campylobacter ureolyticus]QKF84613.1 hypothetical protein CURT_1140 [Campylobacter ureolyticus]QQY35222.1 hypothetical protein I6I59_06795 [Campylobacter ureolyticus]SUX21947.1 Uncharacterised protein [Campylobacter ureolyticus]
MKVRDLYAMICVIFATNFKGVISEDNFKKMAPKWILQNETLSNKTAHEIWQKALKEDYSEICKDYENLKKFFKMDYYCLISKTDMSLFFEKLRYQKPFKELDESHAANMLAFLAVILKSDDGEKTHNFLGLYLTKYFMESFRALSEILKTKSKSDYYKALGWFLEDYLNMLKTTLGLKI